MAACTPGSWSARTLVNGSYVWECDVVGSSSNDYYTKVIDFVDPTRPFYVLVNTAAANTGGVSPVDLWGGWSSSGVSGDGATVAWVSADGFEIHGAMCDDVQSLTKTILLNPAYTGTAVQGAAGVMGHRCPPQVPYYVVNVDAGAAASVTVHFVVIQKL